MTLPVNEIKIEIMWRHLVFFGLLYFVQGAALAYVINFQKPYLHSQGISNETIGLFTSLLLIPFIGKVVLGWVSDRLSLGRWGARKPYMLLGLLVFAVSYFSISFVEPGSHFTLFASLTWLASLGLALFDTCADGWAVDVARPEEQSSIQAAMVAGKSIGLLLMAFLFGRWVEGNGYSIVFLTLSIMALAVWILVLMMPHRDAPKTSSALIHQPKDLFQGFYLAFALFGIVYSIASFGTDGLLTLHLTDEHKMGVTDIGDFGVARGVGALVGAGVYAWLNRFASPRRLQFVALGGLSLGCLLPLTGLDFLVSGLIWGLAWGFQETAYVTLAMRFSQGAFAATFFAIAMIFSNLGTSLGEAFGAPMVTSIGYHGVFGVFSGIAALSMIFLPKALSRIRG